MKLQEIVLDIRTKNGFTQDDLAERLFVTRQAVSRWESGESIPNIETLKSISQKFGVAVDTLLGVEINRICQCCTYPLNDMKELGTNKDGTLNTDYCIYCYKNGEWIDPNQTVQGVIEYTIPYMTSPSITKEEAKQYLIKLVPTLKRWK